MFFKLHMKCNAVLTYCTRITWKRETSENEVMVLGFIATVQHKENGVSAHSGGFLQTSAHSTLECSNIRPFRLPR